MAKHVLCDLNLHGNSIIDVCLESKSSLPTGNVGAGRILLVGTDVKYYDGSAWHTIAKATGITALSNRVSALETKVGGASSGLVKSVADLQARLDTLTGGAGGSISSMIATAIASKQDKLTAGNGISISGNTVSAKVDPASGNRLSSLVDGLYVSGNDYSIRRAPTTPGFAASYELTCNGSAVFGAAKIDIPKDMVISSGTVRAATDADKTADSSVIVGDLYIVLTLAVTGGLVFIPAKSLVDTYSGSTYINVSGYTVSLNYTVLKNKIDTDLVASVRTMAGAALPKSGGTMTGAINMDSNRISGLPAPSSSSDAATKNYADAAKTSAITTVTGGETTYNTLKKVGDAIRNLNLNLGGLEFFDKSFTATAGSGVITENEDAYLVALAASYNDELVDVGVSRGAGGLKAEWNITGLSGTITLRGLIVNL